MKPGDKVRYIGNKYQYPKGQNGIFKSDHHRDPNMCFVVYSWADDPDNYMNYTGVSTPRHLLKPGWDENDRKNKETE